MSGVFDAYGRYYDLLYADKDYAGEAAYLAARIQELAPQARTILELGCGTGAHAEHLVRMGYSVHGIDMSDTMLERAQERSARLPADFRDRLDFSRGNVRDVRKAQAYDIVVSLFHVMSYQETNAEVEAVFRTAAAHLHSGGLFLFDFWYGPAVLTQRPEVKVKRLEDDDVRIVRIAEPVVHQDRNVVDVNYSMIVERKANGTMQWLNERHRMRYFFLPELERYRAGLFDERSTSSWMSSEVPDTSSWAAMQVLSRI